MRVIRALAALRIPAWCICVLCAFVPLLLGGCVFSDTITERVYDNKEDSTVDENMAPIYLNMPNAAQTSDEMPNLDNDPNSTSASEEEQAIPQYTASARKANSKLPAPQPHYSADAKKAGEASVKASAKSTSKIQQAAGTDTNKRDENGSKERRTENAANNDTASDENGASGNTGGGKGKGKGSGGTGSTYTGDPEADEPVIPDGINEVAAVGNNALIVSMLSGKAKNAPLLACDSDMKSQTSSVLKARSISRAKALWKNNGSSAGDLSSANFNKLVNNVVPDLVFVTEGSKTLSEAQKKELAKKSIDVYYLPELTSAKRIKFAVKVVGMILANGKVAGAEDAYKKYLSYHDSLINSYRDKCGGITGGYDFDKDTDAKASDTTKVTLFVDRWDTKARYNDPYDFLDSSDGVAVASLGFAASPLNYYLSCGGVLNNASSSITRSNSSAERGIVWQYAQNLLPYDFNKWKGLDAASYDLCAHIRGGVFRSDLLWYTTDGSSAGYGLGTEDFPAVVTKNQGLATRMKNASKGSHSLYYPHGRISLTNGFSIGYFTDSAKSNYIESCIGNKGTGTSTLDGKTFDVYTNPKGLCQSGSGDALCSWCNGSPESVLEASWAYYKFRHGKQEDFQKDVKEFYQTFYGYKVTASDLAAIEAGAKN